MADGYTQPYINQVSFSPHCGVNITRVADNESRWYQTRNDGICVSDRPLQKGDCYEISIRGDGHVMVGLAGSFPTDNTIEHGHLLPLSAGNWTQVRLKNESEKISVKCLDKKRICIYQSEETKLDHVMNLSEKNKHYIIVNALFGDLEISITQIDEKKAKKKTDSMKWCQTCGLNVLIQENQTTFNLRCINPLGICALEQPLRNGKGFSVTVLESYGTWHYLRVGVSNKAPGSLALEDANKFYNDLPVGDKTAWPKDIVPLLKIRRPKHQQFIYFMWKGRNSILHQEAEGKVVEHEFKDVDLHQPVYVYLEPFRERIKVDSRNISIKDPSDCSPTYLTTISTPISTPISYNTKLPMDQPSSQTHPFQLNSSTENIFPDPSQRSLEQQWDSSVSSTSSSCGPPAFHLAASDVFERSREPQENSLDSSQWNSSDVGEFKNSASAFTDGYDEWVDSASTLVQNSGERENSARNSTCSSGEHDQPDQISAGASQRNSDPKDRSGSREGLSPPPPMPLVSSILNNSGKVVRFPPSLSDQRSSSISRADDNNAKKNIVFEIINQNGENLDKCPINHECNKETKFENNISRKDNLAKEHDAQQSEKLQQSSSTSFTKTANIPNIPQDFKMDTPSRQNTHEITTKDVETLKINKLANLPTNPTGNHGQPFPAGHVPHHRAVSEHVTNTRQSSEKPVRKAFSLNVAKMKNFYPGQLQNLQKLSEEQTKFEDSKITQTHELQVSADKIKPQFHNGSKMAETSCEDVRTRSDYGQKQNSAKSSKESNPATGTDRFQQHAEDEQWRDCLREHYTYFIDRVDPVPLADKLFEKSCLSYAEHENICSTSPRNRQCRELIQILLLKLHRRREVLASLDLTDQTNIADKFRRFMSK